LIGLDAGVGVEARFEQVDRSLVEAGERVLRRDGVVGVVLGADERVNGGASLLDPGTRCDRFADPILP